MDVQVQQGGMRMLWEPMSDRARQWADEHRERLEDALAPPGTECLIRYGEPILREMQELGFTIEGGGEA